jgi:hypothetical protein
VNAFINKSLIYSIDCERCHGPGASHVKFQEENPDERGGKFIVSFKNLSRSQKIDQCAVCHSGTKNIQLRSTFGFRPGDSLDAYIQRVYTPYMKADVHGNQSLLLAQSKCYINSKMDCSNCHNTHQMDRGNYSKYAQYCQSCHTIEKHNFCKAADSSNISYLKDNCTRCHMPAQPSQAITVQTSNNKAVIACQVINHRIAIYPEESTKIMAFINNKNKGREH